MRMKCRECGDILESKEVRRTKHLTYSTPWNNEENDKASRKWHECIGGVGSMDDPSYDLDNDNTVAIGYCGCRGWP